MRRVIETGAVGDRRGQVCSVMAAVLVLCLWGMGCAGSQRPVKACLSLVPSHNLNSFEGQAHVVVVSMYPLQNASAFETVDPSDLLGGARPPGLTGDPWEVTVYPGKIQTLEEKLPRDTVFLGLVADFYNGPSRTVVEADCPTLGFGGTKIVLSSSDLQVE